jgi:hypothetical protein
MCLMIKRNTSSLTVFSENRKNKISIPLLGNITSRTERSIEKRSIRRLKSLHTMLHSYQMHTKIVIILKLNFVNFIVRD